MKCEVFIFDMLLTCSAIYIINNWTEIRLHFHSFSMKSKFYILFKFIATSSMVQSSICKLFLNWNTYIFILSLSSMLLEAISLKMDRKTKTTNSLKKTTTNNVSCSFDFFLVKKKRLTEYTSDIMRQTFFPCNLDFSHH